MTGGFVVVLVPHFRAGCVILISVVCHPCQMA